MDSVPEHQLCPSCSPSQKRSGNKTGPSSTAGLNEPLLSGLNNWCLSLGSLKEKETVFGAGSLRVGRTGQPRDRSEGQRGEAEKEREAMHVAMPATAPVEGAPSKTGSFPWQGLHYNRASIRSRGSICGILGRASRHRAPNCAPQVRLDGFIHWLHPLSTGPHRTTSSVVM